MENSVLNPNMFHESDVFSHFCGVGLSILTILPILPIFDLFWAFWGGGWRGKVCVLGAWMGTYLESHIVYNDTLVIKGGLWVN